MSSPSQVEAVPIGVDAIQWPVNMEGSPVLAVFYASIAVNNVIRPWDSPCAAVL